MTAYVPIPSGFPLGGAGDLKVRDLLGVVINEGEERRDAVDVSCGPGWVGVRSSKDYNPGRFEQRRAARAWFTPSEARDLAALLLEAAALVEEARA